MGMTQPAVSARSRGSRRASVSRCSSAAGGRLKPTPEGLLFYAEATRVLGEVDRLQATTAQIREGQAGRLVIASHPGGGDLAAAAPGRRLSWPQRPGVSVRLISRHSDVVSQLLPSESYDIGIAELPVDETVGAAGRATRCAAWRSCRRAIRSRRARC